jgi:hypothetical protein
MADLIRISVFKNWLTTGTVGWVNTYEFVSFETAGVLDTAWQQAVDSLVDAEKILHLTSVVFNRAVIATWGADGTPYNPASFVTVPLVGTGARDAATIDPLDLNAVFNVRKAVESGRAGKIAYRGVLLESDVDASLSGSWQLTPGGSLQETGTRFGAYEDKMADVMAGGPIGVTLALVSFVQGQTAAVSRPVVDLSPAGASFSKRNHRYFDVYP